MGQDQKARKKLKVMHQSQVRKVYSNIKFIEQEDDEEENEGRYKMVRHHVEKFFK